MHDENAARKVWVEGFAPQFPTIGLIALLEALVKDDDRLIQGATTAPPPLMSALDWPCEAGCANSYIGAMLLGGFADTHATGKTTNPHAATVGKVEEFFARSCFESDRRTGQLADCRFFLNWYDDTPRPEIREKLASWTREVIADRPADYDDRFPPPPATDITPTAVVRYDPFK